MCKQHWRNLKRVILLKAEANPGAYSIKGREVKIDFEYAAFKNFNEKRILELSKRIKLLAGK